MAHHPTWGSGKEGKHADKNDSVRYTINCRIRKQEKKKKKKRKNKARLVVLGVGEKLKYSKCNK